MITVDNKFEIGQEVFVVIKEKRMINTKQTCGMCLGEGKIMYRGYKSICPMCNGLKELNLESKKRNIYTVDPTPTCNSKFSIFRYKRRKFFAVSIRQCIL